MTSREPTETVLEAAWELADILDCGQLTWEEILAETELGESTLRRASRLLGLAGVIAFDRGSGKWSRVEDVEIPVELLPRSALVLEIKDQRARQLKALRSVHEEYAKAKVNAPDSWTGPTYARAMQLFCDAIGVPLDPKEWGVEQPVHPDRFAVARAAMDALTGPERVEVISHYLGSAKKALRSLNGREAKD